MWPSTEWNLTLPLRHRNGPASSVVCEKFPRLSKKKIRLGVFTETQIRQFFRQFGLAHSDDKNAVWNAYQHVATGFLGNVNAINFRKLVEDPISSYKNSLYSHCMPCRLTAVPYVMKVVSIFTRISQQWRTDTRANGVQPCRPITAGWWGGMLWEFSTSDKQKGTSFNSGKFTTVFCFHTAI